MVSDTLKVKPRARPSLSVYHLVRKCKWEIAEGGNLIELDERAHSVDRDYSKLIEPKGHQQVRMFSKENCFHDRGWTVVDTVDPVEEPSSARPLGFGELLHKPQIGQVREFSAHIAYAEIFS